MSKSKAEIARLQLNAQAQAVLVQSFIKKEIGIPRQPIVTSGDIYEPPGEIDYSQFVRDKKNVKKKAK